MWWINCIDDPNYFLTFLRLTPFARRLCSYSQQKGKSIFLPLDSVFSHGTSLGQRHVSQHGTGILKSTCAAVLVLTPTTQPPLWEQFQASRVEAETCGVEPGLSVVWAEAILNRLTARQLSNTRGSPAKVSRAARWPIAATWGNPDEINWAHPSWTLQTREANECLLLHVTEVLWVFRSAFVAINNQCMQKTNFVQYVLIHLIFVAHLPYTRPYVQRKEAGYTTALFYEDKVGNKITNPEKRVPIPHIIFILFACLKWPVKGHVCRLVASQGQRSKCELKE